MRSKFEHLLLSFLLGLTVLLGLSFWLNTFFGFNIFYIAHWNELAKLQASQMPINNNFYLSFGVAIFIFVLGLFLIYRKGSKKNYITNTPRQENIPSLSQKIISTQKEEKKENDFVAVSTTINMDRPPRLNLPKNMAQIVEQKQELRATNYQPQKESTTSTNPYNSIISETFSSNGYIVKPNPTISGFVPNLFAIGNNEVLWIGGVDCDINKMMTAIQKLQSVFQETLEDIKININSFILDTMNKYNEQNSPVLIFKTIDELKTFVNEHPFDKEGYEKENFDAYSEYIDTIIQYIKNI